MAVAGLCPSRPRPDEELVAALDAGVPRVRPVPVGFIPRPPPIFRPPVEGEENKERKQNKCSVL